MVFARINPTETNVCESRERTRKENLRGPLNPEGFFSFLGGTVPSTTPEIQQDHCRVVSVILSLMKKNSTRKQDNYELRDEKDLSNMSFYIRRVGHGKTYSVPIPLIFRKTEYGIKSSPTLAVGYTKKRMDPKDAYDRERRV